MTLAPDTTAETAKLTETRIRLWRSDSRIAGYTDFLTPGEAARHLLENPKKYTQIQLVSPDNGVLTAWSCVDLEDFLRNSRTVLYRGGHKTLFDFLETAIANWSMMEQFKVLSGEMSFPGIFGGK